MTLLTAVYGARVWVKISELQSVPQGLLTYFQQMFRVLQCLE